MESLQEVKRWNCRLSFFGLSTLVFDLNKFVPSKSRIFLSILVGLFFIVLFCFQIVYTKFENLDVAYVFMKGYLVFGSNIVSFMLVVSALLHSQQTAELLHQAIQHFIFKSGTLIPVLKIVLITIFIFTFSLGLDFTQLYFSDDNRLMVILNSLSIHFSLFYILVHIYHFAIFLTWLRNSLKVLNENIIGLNDNSKEKKYLNTTKDQKQNILKIREWRIQFHEILVIISNLDGVFSFQNLVTVGHNFILGTLFAYGGLSKAISFIYTPIITDDIIDLLVQLKWAALSFACIYGLILPSRFVSKQINEIVDAVFYELAYPTQMDLKDELHNFAIQLMNIDITISPHGFFQLNNKLLLSIIGALLSYLVVLIQFRVSSFI